MPSCDRHPWAALDNVGGCHFCMTEAMSRDEQTAEIVQRRAETLAGKQAELERRIGAAGIPQRYQAFNFDTFPATTREAKRAVAVMRSYVNQWPKLRRQGVSALLVGGTGTGKSGLAIAVANALIREGLGTAHFITAYGAVRHQRDTWGRKRRTERDALQDLLTPDLLILDDVGASVGSDAEMTMLFEVINGRYAEQKPTFLTSNLPLEDWDSPSGKRPGLRTYLGQRVIDRFRDDGSFTLAFDWPSLRGARE